MPNKRKGPATGDPDVEAPEGPITSEDVTDLPDETEEPAAAPEMSEAAEKAVEEGGAEFEAEEGVPLTEAEQRANAQAEAAEEAEDEERPNRDLPADEPAAAPAAPTMEDDLPGSFAIVAGDGSGDEVTEGSLAEAYGLRIFGEGFPAPGEVIIDVALEDGQNHQRFSAYTSDGVIDMQLLGISGPGVWVLHAEAPVTQVGEGPDDHGQVIRRSEEVEFEVLTDEVASRKAAKKSKSKKVEDDDGGE